jgi:outer membrane protein OmpA-like peptidoglycan-associated protein
VKRPRALLTGSRLGALAFALLLATPTLARAQQNPSGALERFQPVPAGDAMFGVPSPAIGGHLVPRATAIFDFAYRPLSIQNGTQRYVIVSRQAFLHIDASLALWDRLLVSADMPFALVQSGDNPTVAGVDFLSPNGPQVGDLRLGAKARIYGEFWDPFQIGVGGYVYVPTAPHTSYAGDGAVRGLPQVLLGGRAPHFVWSASLGTELRASTHPHTFEAGAAAAAVVGEEVFQIGPELTLAVPFSGDNSFSTSRVKIATASPTAAELLLGAKVRPIRPLVIGVGAGPGLTHGFGTPVFFAVGSIGYEPLPPRTIDTDKDGIPDKEDACPKVPGVKNPDPKKNGCPSDRDNDGIPDSEDACPDVPGVRSDDSKKNGCPPDRDGDGIPDSEDACPDTPGVKSDDPKKNGCPPDRDGDGIPDAEDACPDTPGVKSDDPKKNGCPPDTDGDGIPDAEDACPTEPGPRDPDPKKNGCPLVEVTATEIKIRGQVKFLFGKSGITQTVDPISDELLTEVRDAIKEHAEIELIEVQGHADVVGPETYNVTLSRERANAVRTWLVKRGIEPRKLIAKGYGSKMPQAENNSEDGRKENRRVQFIIIKMVLKKP